MQGNHRPDCRHARPVITRRRLAASIASIGGVWSIGRFGNTAAQDNAPTFAAITNLSEEGVGGADTLVFRLMELLLPDRISRKKSARGNFRVAPVTIHTSFRGNQHRLSRCIDSPLQLPGVA